MEDKWIEITSEWQKESSFIAKNGAGGTVQMGPLNGQPGIGPMQLLLVALAGCTGMDIVGILKKKKIDLENFLIRVRGLRAESYPMVWDEIQVEYILTGKNIRPKDVEQAIQLSEEKYCSVGAMLGKSAKITSEYQINPS